MGVTTDGESAVFLVSAASGTTGDGDCEPDDTCTFLYMKAGQTQSFEAVDDNDQVVTYKLKLIETNVEDDRGSKARLQLEARQCLAPGRSAAQGARAHRARSPRRAFGSRIPKPSASKGMARPISLSRK